MAFLHQLKSTKLAFYINRYQPYEALKEVIRDPSDYHINFFLKHNTWKWDMAKVYDTIAQMLPVLDWKLVSFFQQLGDSFAIAYCSLVTYDLDMLLKEDAAPYVTFLTFRYQVECLKHDYVTALDNIQSSMVTLDDPSKADEWMTYAGIILSDDEAFYYEETNYQWYLNMLDIMDMIPRYRNTYELKRLSEILFTDKNEEVVMVALLPLMTQKHVDRFIQSLINYAQSEERNNTESYNSLLRTLKPRYKQLEELEYINI